jgi:hypothetical protein
LLRSRLFCLVLLLGACAREEPATPAPAEAPQVDRDTWWNRATLKPSGKERILAPRELRALLAEARQRGFDADEDWYGQRSRWAYKRILSVDPEDLEANAGTGRRTLQSIEGFQALWKRMAEARVPSDLIIELLDRYHGWVIDDEPIFLDRDEYEVEKARLREAAGHLDRMDADPEYAAVHKALRHVKTSFHNDYPFLYVKAGPFLVFYTARDLQRDAEADEEAETERIATREEYYRRRLAEWTGVYEDLLRDIHKLYPKVYRKYVLDSNVIFHQWIFGERSWYMDFLERLRKEELAPPHRTGFFHGATDWAYLYEPGEGGSMPATEEMLPETAAYLAAVQILRRWAKDRKDPTRNHLDHSRHYWFKEGWPSFLAARRVEKSAVGRILRPGAWRLPSLESVVERRSRIDRRSYLLAAGDGDGEETFTPPDGGYTDLAWLLMEHLQAHHPDACERFLLSQIEGTGGRFESFGKCFGVTSAADWGKLERAVYARLKKKEE